MSDRYKISERIVSREVDDGIVLINLDSGFYYSFNGTACFIFNMLKKDKDTAEVVDELKAEFDISEEEARDDLKKFIGTLEKEEIVSRLS
ncbi:MAG: PqqD family protein [Candidatus Fermentibacteria bacterium]